jgi:hypothetical protein
MKNEFEVLCELYQVAIDGKAPLDLVFELEKDIEKFSKLNRLLKYGLQ